MKFTQIIWQSVYNTFILRVLNRKCMERNVMTSFQILSSFECFLPHFQTRITTTKFDRQQNLFFYLQCALFTSCNVSNNTGLVYARTEGGVWSTKCRQAWKG